MTLPLHDLAAAVPITEAAPAGDQAVQLGGYARARRDRMDERHLFEFILRHAGAEVRTDSGVREALKVCESWRLEVLVSDIAMPDEDGYVLRATQ